MTSVRRPRQFSPFRGGFHAFRVRYAQDTSKYTTVSSHFAMQRPVVEEDASVSELKEKLKQYSTFIDTKLHPALKRAVTSRERVEHEVKEYQELLDKLNAVETKVPLQAMVNLGHELVYCNAEVQDPSTIYVDVGMGFFVQLTRDEAPGVIQKRIEFLQNQVLPKRVEDASRVASHLESSLMIVEALSQHLQELQQE